ncbi:hypothetical protein TNCV_4519381 [Trichonephila clavipes]|nr:hypothetical protein TNCV_4519381 [Trichonephila clavipes]
MGTPPLSECSPSKLGWKEAEKRIITFMGLNAPASDRYNRAPCHVEARGLDLTTSSGWHQKHQQKFKWIVWPTRSSDHYSTQHIWDDLKKLQLINPLSELYRN